LNPESSPNPGPAARRRAKAALDATLASPPSIGDVVAYCCQRAPWVAAAGLALALLAILYVVHNFAMSTSTDQLLDASLPWRQHEAAFNRAFPPDGAQIVVVVDGATPAIAEQAAASLADRLASRTDRFTSVRRPDGGDFWRREGLLYNALDDVEATTAQMIKAQPFLGPLAADPSLRGLAGALSTAAQGVTRGDAKLDDLDTPLTTLGDALERVERGQPAVFSWSRMISGKPDDPRALRRLILIGPKLDFAKLQPGSDPSSTIRATARALGLDAAHGVRVRLTGPVPIADDEFGSLSEGVGVIAALAFAAILLMLWLAVRSARVMTAILVTMFAGLACTLAVGLMLFHLFNVISVACIPLFVGLGIDFGIQFSVRFRSERTGEASAAQALIAAGRGMGPPLCLAAAAIASGFLAFAPTNYRGVSQLGVVAGLGMIIALVLNLTLLPALLKLMDPPGVGEGADDAGLQKLDAFMLTHRRIVVGSGVGAALVCAALLPLLRFDFNPMHLRSAKVESMAALLELMKDPDQSPDTLDVLRPSLGAADALAARLARLPQVAQTRTLDSFVPGQQSEKLAAIADADTLLDLTLNPLAALPPPTDAEVAASLVATAADLRAAAGAARAPSADHARRLAGLLDRLAKAPPAVRARAADVLISGLNVSLDQMRALLQAQPVTLDSLPADLKRDWTTPDGRQRVSVVPRGDSNDNAVLRRFTDAVLKIAPDASGAPISIQEGGKTVVGAFTEAGVLSFVAITLLLFAVLRRTRDVAITMAPIVLTGLLTMGSCVLIGQPLNFANIIALPLLFGIGVAFHIYFVMAWRRGGSHLLLSSLTRAIFFSALTTATGFGSLWASSHPGTASMGKLLMISLVWTLVSALLFQPALMGPPPADAATAN
jgi:hopanoid biosynthesis associated RND transporter like protein HpnN